MLSVIDCITDARHLVKVWLWQWLVMKWHWHTTLTHLILDMAHIKEGFSTIVRASRGTKGRVKIVRHGEVDEPHRCAKMRNQALRAELNES